MLICVDLDGTLLDTVPANAASYRAALEELGFTVTDEYYAERCNGGHYTRFLPPLMGGAPSTADVERVHDRKKALYSDFLDAVRPNTALMEILKTMRAAGHDLACVTTGSKQNATEVLEHFGVPSLTSLGLDERDRRYLAAGALLIYLNDTQKNALPHLTQLTIYQGERTMFLDRMTRRNLELVESLRAGERRGRMPRSLT